MAIIPTPKANKSGFVITIPLGYSLSAFTNVTENNWRYFFPGHAVICLLPKRDFYLDKAVSENSQFSTRIRMEFNGKRR